jgi:hypothetical protein
MRSPWFVVLSIFAILLPAARSSTRACIAPEDALKHVGKNICITAHIYRVVDATDGIHFIDVCSPETADADCHFFILSLGRDERSVGDLQSLVNRTIQIRGTVHTIQGRAEIVFSSQQQLHGGKEKFHPNPRLVKGFSAENGGQAFSARNGSMGQHGVHFKHRGK